MPYYGGGGGSSGGGGGNVFAATLTEGVATTVASTTIAEDSATGGDFIATVWADDGTNFQALTISARWSVVNVGGTLTTTLSAVESVSGGSSGTLTGVLTLVDGGSGLLQFKLNCTSSLTQTTLNARGFARKDFGSW